MVEIKGKDIVFRIDSLLKQKNLKRKAVADAVGISLQPFTAWANRGSIPGADIAYHIADYLNVSLEWLLTGQEKKSEKLSSDERNMLEAYRLLDEKDRQELKAIAELKLSLNMSRLGEGAEEEPSA